MTPDYLAARVHALIAQWRKQAKVNREMVADTGVWRGIAGGQEQCALDLEAALAAARPQGRDITPVPSYQPPMDLNWEREYQRICEVAVENLARAEAAEAALAVALAQKPPDDAFATRLAQRLHNEALRGPNDAELEIPEAVRIIQEELRALVPQPETEP